MRIDKWLWAARFYKTRSIAADAVDGGRVRINGAPVKPAKEVRIGDRIALRAGEQDWEILVRGLDEFRRPAPEAQRLYEETAESAQRRAEAAELRKLAPAPDPDQRGRPTKRDRRQLGRFRGF
jgi:ribosome-associated heat shock protein Hsp15